MFTLPKKLHKKRALMSRDDLIECLNKQVDILNLNVNGKLSVKSASQMTFNDLTSDSLIKLQIVMVLAQATGAEIELEKLSKCPTLLDAIDLISSTAKQSR